MRLTILGGGGFRVPMVHQALLGDNLVTELTLYDTDETRLGAIRRVLADQAGGHLAPPTVTATTDLDKAVLGADFVFSAIRVGGLDGRVVDERVAAVQGVLGQETVGAGGIAYGLRTVPVAVRIAQRIAALAPNAWVINFTNPAGLVTEAMAEHLGGKVIGICDSPVGLCRRVARVLGVDARSARFDYAGLNHLGWLQGVEVDGTDVLPGLFTDDGLLTSFEEGALFGADLLRALQSVPNEYLHYYYFNREAVAAAHTRGAFLRDQQQHFYDVMAVSTTPLATWDATRHEREATYMAENREAAGLGERDDADVESGGYEKVALALMRAIARDDATTLILNVRNKNRRIGVLDEDAVVEVPCLVDAGGARPVTGSQLAEHAAGLVASVKAVDRTVIRAAMTRDREAARLAFALHPLIDSYTVAGRLLDGYLEELPGLSYLR